jgi:hypothetical protein
MRLLIIVATSFVLVASPIAVRAQEDDLSLIDDVESRADGKDAQRPKNGARSAIPETLSEALAQALESNPEMLLAEAKLRQAEAELYQAKLKAVQEVTIAYHEYQAKLREHKVHLDANKKVPGSNPAHVIAKMNDETAESEAKLAYLLGAGANQPPFGPGGVTAKSMLLRDMSARREATANALEMMRQQQMHLQQPKAPAEKRPEIPEKYRHILQKPVTVKFTSVPLNQIVDEFNRLTGNELPILSQATPLLRVPVSVDLSKEVSLQTALELVADLTGCVFVFRDYGLLVLPDSSLASQYPRSAMIPERP